MTGTRSCDLPTGALLSLSAELDRAETVDGAVHGAAELANAAFEQPTVVVHKYDPATGTVSTIGSRVPPPVPMDSAPDEAPERVVERLRTQDDGPPAAGESGAIVDADPWGPLGAEAIVPVGSRWVLRVGVTESSELDETAVAVVDGIAANLETVLERIGRRQNRQRELDSFRRAVEEAADGVAILDDGEYTYVNQAHAEMYGFDDKDDLLGTSWRTLYDDEEVARLEAEAFPALEADGHWRGPATGSRPDGSTFPTDLSLSVSEDGRHFCTVRDETERRARERELELKERAMDEATVGIQITDPTREGNPLVYVNDGFERMTGYARDEALGRNPRFLQGDGTDPRKTAQLRDAIDAEEPISLELENRRRDGTSYWSRVSVTPVTGEDGTVTNYVGIQQDVTERRARSQWLRAFLNRGPLLFIKTRQVDGEAVVDSCNDRFLSRLGYDREEIEGEPLASLYTAESAADLREGGYEDALAGAFEMSERTLVSTDGEPVHALLRAVPRRDGSDGTNALFVDISERKSAHQKLRQQQERLELTLSGTSTGIVEWDLRTDVVAWNETLVDIVGRDVESVEGFRDAIHPDDSDDVRRELETMIETGEPWTGEFRMVTPDGDAVWLATRATPVYDDDGSPVRVLATGTDISERKAEEHERRRNERRFQSLFDDPEMLVGLLDTDGTLLKVNATAVAYVDRTAAELTGRPFPATPWWSHSEAVRDDVREWIRRAADGEYVEYSTIHRRPDGERRHIEGTVRPVTDAEGTVTSLLISGRDVTEREQQRRELEDRQRKLDLVLSNTDTAVVEFDPERGAVEWDGLPGGADIGSPETIEEFIEMVHSEDRPRVRSAFETLRDGERAVDVEFRFVEVDGTVTWVTAQAVSIRGDTRSPASGAVGIATDITDLKQQQRELESFQRAIEEAADGVAVLDDGEYVYIDRTHVEMYGFDSKDDLLGDTWRRLYDDAEVARLEELAFPALEADGHWRGAVTGTRPDGSTFPAELSLTIVGDGRLVCTVRDETEKRERKRELQLKERAMDEANVGITISDPNREDDPLVYVNDGFVEQTGYTREEALGRTRWFPWTDDEDRPALETLRDAIAAEEPTTVEFRDRRTDSGWSWVRLSVTPVYDDDGDLANHIGIQQDVTDEVRRKHELYEERERFRLLTESVDEYAFLVVDENGTIQTWTAGAETLFGYDADTALGLSMAELHPESDRESGRPERLIQQARIAGESADEGWRVRADGSEFYADVRYAPLESDDGEFRGYAAIVRDMTERRRQQRRTERFVEESEDVVTVVDPDGTITYASGSTERHFGHDPDAFVGENLFDYVHPGGREDAMETFFDCVDGAETTVAECRLRSAGGEWLNVEGRYRNMLDDDAIDGILVYLRDVTESRDRARRFKSIFNQTFQFTALMQPDGTVLEVNDAALEFSGVGRRDVVGTSFFELPWWTHSEAVYDEVRGATERAADGEFVRYQTEVRGSSGLATIDFSLKPVRDEDDDVSLLVAEGRDITDREHHKRHLEVMQRVMRHNMRNDLTKLRGWAQLMAEEENGERRGEQFESVERTVDKWESMTEKMRKINQLLRRQQSNYATMECETAVRDAVDPVRETYDDLTVLTESSDAGSVQVPTTILDAVRELVENAATASHDATVEVELARSGDDWIEVSVRDDGPGMPEMEANVLEAGEETPLNHGLGLGLWMVRMVVTQAGGTVSVAASADGTTVRLRVPATRESGRPIVGAAE